MPLPTPGNRPRFEGRASGMHLVQRFASFAARHQAVGPLVWVFSIQYFVVQIVVASAWKQPPYSWRLNAISDLGATGCGTFDGRSMCSPWHALMNASLIVLGLSMAVGSALTHQQLRSSRVGLWMMAAAGTGVILVGLVPLDTVYWLHIAGADLALLLGNLALITLGCVLRLGRWFRWYSITSGAVALIALCLFLTHHRFFLELGGMERAAAYPQTIWLVVSGLYLLKVRNHVAAPTPAGVV